MTKKLKNNFFFSITNKYFKEIITKNLVTFKLLKNGMKLRIKTFNIMEVH